MASTTQPDGNIDLAAVQREFEFFSELTKERSPLYAALSAFIATNKTLLAMAAQSQHRQPAVNMLLGAVHDLLLAGTEHELREFYATVDGIRPAAEAGPVFADFCTQHEDPILERIRGRRVQTNEVGRAGVLMAGVALAWDKAGEPPMYLIEIGCSAGLNLMMDHFQYTWTDADGALLHECGGPSSVRLRTTLRGERGALLPEELPEIVDRLGIDIAPVDVMDDASMRWIESLIWPDELDRHRLFQAAVRVARRDPPPIIAGDGLALLPAVLEAVPDDVFPCIYHSHATYQQPKPWRAEFQAMLDSIGATRDLAHVSQEWLGDDTGPKLVMTMYKNGRKRETLLADAHHHGRWMTWLEGDEHKGDG